jgi:hypothetical protein
MLLGLPQATQVFTDCEIWMMGRLVPGGITRYFHFAMVSDIFPIFSIRFVQKRMETWILVLSIFFAVGRASFPRALADDFSNRQSEFLLESWQVEDGVPRHSVRSLFQTRDGYLWVGTYHGLGRFDGTRFTTFNTANTTNLTSDAVATLFQDREGRLWIGTTGGGLVRYACGRLHPVKLAPMIPRNWWNKSMKTRTASCGS